MQMTWDRLGPRYEELEQHPLTPENVEDWLHNWSELEKDVEEQLTLLQRAKDEDTRDRSAEDAYLTFIREVIPQAQVAGQLLKVKLLALEGYRPDAEHGEFVKRFRNEAELFREENAPLLAEEAALSSEYNTLMGGLTVELDGETLTILKAQKKLREPDRELRERAWRAVHNAELSVADELDALFLKLLELRRRIAKNAGLDYRSYAWRRWNRFDYTPEESMALHESIAGEVVPLAAKLREERKGELKLPALRPWDLSVDPQGERRSNRLRQRRNSRRVWCASSAASTPSWRSSSAASGAAGSTWRRARARCRGSGIRAFFPSARCPTSTTAPTAPTAT